MASDDIYFECAFCNKPYSKQQVSEILSEFEVAGVKQIAFVCPECRKGFAIEKDDNADPLEQVKRSNLKIKGLEHEPFQNYEGPLIESHEDIPADQDYGEDFPAKRDYGKDYGEVFPDDQDWGDDFLTEIYYEQEPQPQPPLGPPGTPTDSQIEPDNRIDKKPEGKFRLTEVGNAERLVSNFGNDIHYCYPWKKWIVWNGKYWEKDNSGEIMRMAKKTLKRILMEAEHISDEKIKIALKAHATKSETNYRLTSMIKVAQSELGISVKPEDLDKNSWLLNVQNGTIDLQKGIFLPHTREHLISKITPMEYNPNATCPKWDNFLNRIMDRNQNVIQYIKKAIGYSLTGDNREQCFFFYMAQEKMENPPFLKR